MEPHPAIALRREPGPWTRSLAALSLRVGLGLVFLTAGLGKFEGMKQGGYPGGMVQQFEKTRLDPAQVRLFARVLPYAEVALGAGLLAGLFTTLTAGLTAVLLALLLFGQTALNKTEMYPNMLVYMLVNAGILWLSPVTSNYISLDGLLFGWFWAPRSEGTYHREPESASGGRRR